MSQTQKAQDKLQARLSPIIELLHKHRLVEKLVHRQRQPRQELVESLIHRQQLAELQRMLTNLHAADISHLLEMLPPDERQLVWSQVPVALGGEVLDEVSDTVAAALVETMDRQRLRAMLEPLDADELSTIAEHIPEDMLQELYRSLEAGERDWLQSSIAYPEDTVGYLMSSDMVVIQQTNTVKQVIKALRKRKELPDQTDKLFVVDEHHRLQGVLPLPTLLLHPPRQAVSEIMARDVATFTPQDEARAAALAFERYDLISAPVVDERGKLLGRLTVDVVMDFIREEAEEDVLNREGLPGDADLFAPVLRSARERWLWLSINLITAFIASRVIGLFEDSIEKLVALATLMPIVASVGGNTGNQTIALFIRGLALDQINDSNVRYLAFKELGVSAINGVIWGSLMGLIAFVLYQSMSLGLVMAAAMLLNLVIAALVGICVPMLMHKLGRDPALGSSVLLTFSTDSMGFFIFLGLATVFLLP